MGWSAHCWRVDYLEDEEIEVVALGHAPQNGMVAALLPGLDLPQLDPGVVGCVAEHFPEQLLCGEVTAGAGGQVSAPGQ